MCMKRTGTLFQKHSWEKDFCTVECFQHISLKGEINLGKLPNLEILWFNKSESTTICVQPRKVPSAKVHLEDGQKIVFYL